MADVTVTPADVAPQSGFRSRPGVCGEAIDAGELVFIDRDDDSKLKLADATTAKKARVAGIALASGAAGNEISYAYSGTIELGSGVLGQGEVYGLSATPGKIAPPTDLTAGQLLTLIGFGATADRITLSITKTEIAHS